MQAERAESHPATTEGLESELECLHGPSFGWALACCGWRREEAEEVLQVAYLKVLDGRARFGGRSTFKTWLFAVIRRTAAEQQRSRSVRRFLLTGWQAREPAPPPADDPESDCRRAQTTRRLLGALARLPRRQREVLHLVFYQQLTVDQAAGVLGIGVGSARVHYARGKEKLRRMLGRQEASP